MTAALQGVAEVTADLAESNETLRRVYGVIHFTSPAGLLPVHRDQLRAQCSVTSMEELYLYLLPDGHHLGNTIKRSLLGGDAAGRYHHCSHLLACIIILNLQAQSGT